MGKTDIKILESSLAYENIEDRSLGFIDPIRISEALALCDYGIEDEITQLLEIIEAASAEHPKTAMQAMTMLNGLVKDALKMSGRVGQATYHNQDGDSLTIQQVRSAVAQLPGDSNDRKRLPAGSSQIDPPDRDEQGRFRPISSATEAPTDPTTGRPPQAEEEIVVEAGPEEGNEEGIETQCKDITGKETDD